MYTNLRKLVWFCALGLMLWPTATALAQSAPSSVRASRDCDENVHLDWSSVGGVSSYRVSILREGSGGEEPLTSTPGTSVDLGKLKPGNYQFFVDTDRGTWGSTSVSLGMSNCPTTPVLPPHFDCADIPQRVVVHAIGSGTHCHSVVPGGLGDPSLYAADVLDAIDIWGSDSTVRFCFLKPGRLVFIDTAASPRVTVNLAADHINGATCGTVDRTGMVALLRADGTAVVSPDPPTAPVEPEPESESETLSADICQVTTTAALSLRAGPSVFYARLDTMPLGTRLLVSGRNGDWILVNYKGHWGWSSDAYLTQSGACDAVGESSRVYVSRVADPTPVEDETPEQAQLEPTQTSQFELIDCRLTAGDIINLRAQPGTEQDIEAEIPFRTQLTALDRAGDWFQVEYDGKTGWVNIDYVFRRGACG